MVHLNFNNVESMDINNKMGLYKKRAKNSFIIFCSMKVMEQFGHDCGISRRH